MRAFKKEKIKKSRFGLVYIPYRIIKTKKSQHLKIRFSQASIYPFAVLLRFRDCFVVPPRRDSRVGTQEKADKKAASYLSGRIFTRPYH